MKELELIERIRAGVTTRNPSVRLGIGDDCAMLRVQTGYELAVTTDFCLEGKHFRRDWHSPQSAGHRCLARGLSDLAAMGAKPIAVFLSLAMPRGIEDEWVEGFIDGFQGLANRFVVQLAGGDTSEAPGEHVLANVTCMGVVKKGREVKRSGAQVGDAIYVTGPLGGAAAELAEFAAGEPCPTIDRPGRPNAFPQPRIREGLKLADRWMTSAAIDVSDGLSTDLWHLCEASGVGAEIKAELIPVARGATLEQALHGGEDYELLFTTKPWVRVAKRLSRSAVRRIGTVTAELGVSLDGAELKRGGWEHFRD